MDELRQLAQEILQRNYPQAKAIFLAGSVARGEHTASSDLDLVVIFDRIECAYRESYNYANWPVEAFVHDTHTLTYFINEVDRPSGYPSLASMINDGIVIPNTNALTDKLTQLAKTALKQGPPKWRQSDIDNARYQITDLVTDMLAPRSSAELHASGAALYSQLANYYFRSQNLWSAKAKAIPRRLKQVDQSLAQRFINSFADLFSRASPQQVIELSKYILQAQGGLLFAGDKRYAPASWRTT